MTLSANLPASMLAVPEHLARAIARRWRELEPFARIQWQDTPEHLRFVRDLHRDLVLALRRDAIEMRVIRRLMLDDIRQDIHELERRRLRYTERRQRRRMK